MDGSLQYNCIPFEDLDISEEVPTSQDDFEDGLDSKYNQKLNLDDGILTLYWGIDDIKQEISIGVRCLKRSGWCSVALGTKMVGAHAYIGWLDEDGLKGQVLSYPCNRWKPRGSSL